MIDPGHDFGKNTRHSLEATRRLGEMTATGWPVLVSLSNKDFVGETLDRPVKERLIGTLATTAVSAWLGAQVYRVHEVAETRQVLDMVAVDRGPPAAGGGPPRAGLSCRADGVRPAPGSDRPAARRPVRAADPRRRLPSSPARPPRPRRP